MIFVVAVIVASASAVAARSIVAESDAHRLDGSDRWYQPVCGECERPLGPTMLRCAGPGHRQRPGNGFTLVATVVVSVALAVAAPSGGHIPAYVWFGWLMVILTVTDLDTKLIPNRILFPGSTVAALLLLGGAIADSALDSYARGILAGIGYFVLMLVLALIARGGLGFGDVKLAIIIGVFVGYLSWSHLFVTILWSFILAGAVSLVLLVTRRLSRRDSIPFGPFMTVTAVTTLIVGDRILDWYVG